MLLLLGDQLIRDAGLAVFELVKNAYDADASECIVTLHNINDATSAKITVEDNGSGMSLSTVLNSWLEPGTEFRFDQREAGRRSPKFKRLPLGEKGVGRFAVHKLGRKINVITRVPGELEVLISIDWRQFEGDRYLSEVPVTIAQREPEYFTGRTHGTLITITQLRDSWTRRRVRELHRAVTSICSPFDAPEDFRAELRLKPDNDWRTGLLDARTVLKDALFRAKGTIRGSTLKLNYEFTPLPAMKSRINPRSVRNFSTQLMSLDARRAKKLDLIGMGIGPVKFDFRIFDLEPSVLQLASTDKYGLKSFLAANGGVRVYRDGVRIFDFGEPGNDWLDLGGRRVNRPGEKVSNNQIIGAIHLNSKESRGLVEKTNREGFIENDAYVRFREAVIFALTQVEIERAKDKRRIRHEFSRPTLKEPVIEDLAELRDDIEKRGLLEELGGYVDRIEKQFRDVRERLLTAAGPGLTLTVVIHEIEKIIKELSEALKRGAQREKIVTLVKHLSEVIEGLSFLVRTSGNTREKAAVMIKQAIFNTEYRLRAHQIKIVNGIERGDRDFSVKCVRRLIISTLMNLIDNSIYWLENRGARGKQIYVGTTFDLDSKPSIVVADNGPGFQDAPEYLVEPFFTRKPDGMGLGLHIANEVMKIHEGRLVFPSPGEVNVPPQFAGAVVALQFNKTL